MQRKLRKSPTLCSSEFLINNNLNFQNVCQYFDPIISLRICSATAVVKQVNAQIENVANLFTRTSNWQYVQPFQTSHAKLSQKIFLENRKTGCGIVHKLRKPPTFCQMPRWQCPLTICILHIWPRATPYIYSKKEKPLRSLAVVFWILFVDCYENCIMLSITIDESQRPSTNRIG